MKTALSDGETLEQLCALLGKQKEKEGNDKKAPKFDPIKELEALLKSRDKWKQHWLNQHAATGLAYWCGYRDGYNDHSENKDRVLNSGLRNQSVFDTILAKSPQSDRAAITQP